jgi:hypothetical protein
LLASTAPRTCLTTRRSPGPRSARPLNEQGCHAGRVERNLYWVTDGGRFATRDDVATHQQYIADIEASAREALASLNPVPFYMAAGENAWAGVRAHLDTGTERAAAPIIAKYTGVLGGADIEVFTTTTTFAIMQSLRLDRGPSGPVHP